MEDLIIAGTGNSRYLKSISTFLTAYPTYADFAAALIAGTLPVDFNGINLAGITQAGTALNKANLLTDATAALLGLTNAAVPDDAFAALAEKCNIAVGTYTGTGTYGLSNAITLTPGFEPKFLLINSTASANPSGFFVTGDGYERANVNSSVRVTFSSSNVSWYAGYFSGTNTAAQRMFNTSGQVYAWIIWG